VRPRVFLLSPARVGGPRSEMLLRPNATFELAEKLQRGSVSFGEIYSFISGLYFRGKVAYAHAFADAPSAVPSALIIVPGLGLVPLDTPVSSDQLTAIGSVSIESDNRAFRTALVRDAQRLDQSAGPTCSFVLLGSMMIVFIGSTHGKTPPQENAQPSSYTQSPDSSPSRAN